MKVPRGRARGANAGPHNFAVAASATADEHSAASAMMEAASASVEDQAVTWGAQGQGVRKVKTMVKTVGGRRMALLESYGKR